MLKIDLKYQMCFFADFLNDVVPKEVLSVDFDYVFLPDVIEHIDNSVSFLHSLKKCLNRVKCLVITTPNAFRLQNFLNVIN